VPAVSVAEMREVDRVAMEQTGPTLLQMMEHAGMELAQVALEMLGDGWKSSRVIVLAGVATTGQVGSARRGTWRIVGCRCRWCRFAGHRRRMGRWGSSCWRWRRRRRR